MTPQVEAEPKGSVLEALLAFPGQAKPCQDSSMIFLRTSQFARVKLSGVNHI